MRRNTGQRKRSYVKAATPAARTAPTIRGGVRTVRQLIDHAPTAMFIFQGKKNVYVNAAAEQLTGYSSHELLQMNFWEIIHPDFKTVVRKRGSARQRGVKIDARYELKIVRKDGMERWLDYSGAATKWRGKVAVLGSATDITEKKIAERELRQRLGQLETLHQTALAITADLNLSTVLNVLLEKVELFLGIPLVAVIRVREGRSAALETTALRNMNQETWSNFVPEGGGGLTRVVLESKTPVIATDALKDPRVRYPELFRQNGLVSYLGVPLVMGGEAIGDIAIFTKVRREFTQDEIAFISNLASQAAIAAHNARLYEYAKRRSDEAAALNDVARATSRSLDLSVVLRGAVHAIAKIGGFDGARIYLFDEVVASAQLKAAFDSQPGLWSPVKTVSRGSGIIGKVAASGEPAIFEDVELDSRYVEMTQTGGARQAGGRFFGVFPIQTKAKTWGALSCMAREPRSLRTDEIELIVSMCNHVAVAIENASLYQSTADKASELAALYSVVGDCMRFSDVESLLDQITRKILNIFAFDAARIYLSEESQGALKLALHQGFPERVTLPQRYEVGEGLIGLVARSGECLVFDDMQNDKEYTRLAGTRLMWRGGYRGSFFIPLKTREGIVGVMNFVSRNPHPFSPADIERINAIAYHLSIAVGNARLLSQLTQRTRDLEKASKAKDDFLSMISHELRTPLHVIVNYTDYLAGGLAGELLPDVADGIAKVAEHASLLHALVDSILTTAGIEAGVMRSLPSSFSLGQWFEELRCSYDRPLGKELELIWKAPEPDTTLETDPTKLRQILANLIDNAIKCTERGRVTVSAHALCKDEKVILTVQDTGVGIAECDIPGIFEMFKQVDSSAARAHEGVGLGLYIVRKLTELLRGRLTVESKPGVGSKFTVELPLS